MKFIAARCALSLACLGFALPLLADEAKPTDAKALAGDPIPALLQQRMDAMDVDIAGLLAASGTQPQRDPAVQAAMVNYRVVVRHLYETAAGVTDPDFRTAILFKANVLAGAIPAVDRLVAAAPQWVDIAKGAANADAATKAQAAAATDGLARFTKVTLQANEEIADQPGLDKYLAEMLPPLAPLTQIELAGQPTPTIFPATPATATAAATDLPSIDATLQRVQQENLLPPIRAELLAILPRLREGMTMPQTVKIATDYYRQLLNALDLAAQVGSSSVLTEQGRSDLQEQLRISLVLFKDPRTRPGAMHRLAGIGDLASILGRMEHAPLSGAQRTVISGMVQDAVTKLLQPVSAEDGRKMLAALDHLLQARQLVETAAQQPTIPKAQDELEKVKTEGVRLFDDQMATLPGDADSPPDVNAIEETARKIGVVHKNIERLTAMPGVVKEIEPLKLRQPENVEIKLMLWARSIADLPAAFSEGAAEFDTFRNALRLLENARQMQLPTLSDDQIAAYTGGSYKSVQDKFQETTQKLTAALSNRVTPLPPLILEFKTQASLLRVTAALAEISDKDEPMGALNRWGYWRLSGDGIGLLRGSLQGSLAAQYGDVSGEASTLMPALTTLDFKVTAGATENLAKICRMLNPVLTGSSDSLAAAYAAALGTPPQNALLAKSAGALMTASVDLEAAAWAHAAKEDPTSNQLESQGAGALAAIVIEP